MEKEAAKDNIQEEHEQFFEYANEIMEQVKSNGRSTYPIERVIQVGILKQNDYWNS